MLRITGTFLDEITYDIPSNNWGRAEWERDFRVMKDIGIDTVILIRAGLRPQGVQGQRRSLHTSVRSGMLRLRRCLWLPTFLHRAIRMHSGGI